MEDGDFKLEDAMSRGGKTWKDQKDRRAERGIREPKPAERGGMRNLVREALEEQEAIAEEWLTAEEREDEDA